MDELTPYTTTERVKLRLAHIAPGVSIADYINAQEPDPKESRRMRERVYKGNPKTINVLKRLSALFGIHHAFWLEDDREIVARMAKDKIKVEYAAVLS